MLFIDYRALNRLTKRNNALIQRSAEMVDSTGGPVYFSKIDLKTGFHQFRVKRSDIEKIELNTKYGKFEYLVMPMGAGNEAATLQILMNQILHDFNDDYNGVCLADPFIFRKDTEIHYKHI